MGCFRVLGCLGVLGVSMEGIPEYKVGAADFPRRPLADKFLQVAIEPANAYQRTKFKLSSSISLGDMRRSQNKKWELLISPDDL